MKESLYSVSFIALLLLTAAGLTAQVSTRVQAMSQGDHESLVLDLPSADEDDVEDLWEDWLKDNYKVKTKSTRRSKIGELASLNFSLPGVNGGNNLDMYSAVREDGDGAQLTVWIATPRGYVSPSLDQGDYVNAEKMLMQFALAVSKEQIEADVEADEDRLEDLEDELEDMKRDKKRAEDDIEDARKKIVELEEAIRKNELNQESKQREIEEQLRKLEATKRRLKDF
ncbi:hypothetical protein [Lewinella sp. IMCC34183]|uniref:hypothetical protein n=1 Tax=Lewinella sp. IMCC34183 TaxID=2248762 RepID=UPI000E25EEB9|nr:hypothetical protein [Lewinella sp. IMCC34183]